MVQETQAQRFREFLVETLQRGPEAISDRAWRQAWDPSDDPVFDIVTSNDMKNNFCKQSDMLRQSLVKVLLADPESEERKQAWKAAEQIQTDIGKILAAFRQQEDEYGEPVFVDQRELPSENPSRTELEIELEESADTDTRVDIPGSDLTEQETEIVGDLLSECDQSAIFCDHVNVCTANALAKQKRRLMLLTDYRITFCRGFSKINRPTVAATIFLLDVIRLEIDDQFNIIRVIARDDDFYIFARSSAQLKAIMEAFAKQFSLILVGYPSSERVQMPSSYPLVHNPAFTSYDAIKRTFEALVDRSGVILNEFIRCIQFSFDYGKKVLNLKEIIGSQPDQRASYAALLVACQALRYNCSEFDELIASYMPFGDTGMYAVAKLFTPSTAFASIDISNTACAQKSMQILGEALKRPLHPHLKCLNVSENAIGNAGVASLLKALQAANIRLEVLACKKCGLHDKGFEDLASYMKRVQSLKVIDFSSNLPSKSGLDPLFEALMLSPNIERIYLANFGPNTRVSPILQALAQTNLRKLKCLDLSGNRLSLDDAVQLANLMKGSETLNQISLSHCKLTQPQSNYIVDAIVSNRVPHLQFVVDFSRNSSPEGSIWPDAFQALIFPNGCRNLYALNLSECKLSPDEFVSICEHLKGVNPLSVLSFNGSVKTGLFNREACTRAGLAIAELVNAKSSLKILSLAGSKAGMLGPAGVNLVLEALVKNTSLNCLVISNNSLTKSSYNILRRMLGMNTSLQYLSIDYNRPALASLWQLTRGLLASTNVCSNIPRNDFINCIVSEKSRDLVEILSSAIIRRFERNTRRNLTSFFNLESLISSLPWIPRPKLFTGHLDLNNISSIKDDLELPSSYHELVQIHLYECGIPSLLISLGDRVRSRNGLCTKNIFGISENCIKYRRAVDAFYAGQLELINDVQCCALLIVEYLRNRDPLVLSTLTCDQMNAALSSGTAGTLMLLESEVHAQERSVLFWVCDLLSDIISESEYNGSSVHSVAILFTSCLYPIESWLDNDFDKCAFTVPSFIASCIKLRLK